MAKTLVVRPGQMLYARVPSVDAKKPFVRREKVVTFRQTILSEAGGCRQLGSGLGKEAAVLGYDKLGKVDCYEECVSKNRRG